MPDTWGFSRPTAEKLVNLVGGPGALARPQIHRTRQPRIIPAEASAWPTICLRFRPVNASNVAFYGTTASTSWSNFSHYASSDPDSNIYDPDLGITIESTGDSPADSEWLRCEHAGTYHVNIAYVIGTNTNGLGITSGTRVSVLSGGAGGETRWLTAGGSSALGAYPVWVNDHRVVHLTEDGGTIHPVVYALTNAGPTNEGKITIFRTS